MKKTADELLALARTALERAGAAAGMAEAAAYHLVQSEQQGLPTHGMSRVPFYRSMLRNGRADGAAQPSLAAERAAVCLIDNHDALPYESCRWAIDEVIERGRRNGIAFAGIRNSAHVGVLGIHLLPVARAALVGFAFTNSPAAIPTWEGKKALFGTNPIAAVFPRRDGEPLVIDLALTGAAIGAEADSLFPERGNRPRIGQAFLAIDPGALAGHERYFERLEAVVSAMQADPEVRLPGSKRFAAERRANAENITVPDDLMSKIHKLAAA